MNTKTWVINFSLLTSLSIVLSLVSAWIGDIVLQWLFIIAAMVNFAAMVKAINEATRKEDGQ